MLNNNNQEEHHFTNNQGGITLEQLVRYLKPHLYFINLDVISIY